MSSCLSDSNCIPPEYCSSYTCTTGTAPSPAPVGGGTGSTEISGKIYSRFIRGNLLKTRAVTQPEESNVMSEFIQTFVLPLVLSFLFLLGLIYAAKWLSRNPTFLKLMSFADKVQKATQMDAEALNEMGSTENSDGNGQDVEQGSDEKKEEKEEEAEEEAEEEEEEDEEEKEEKATGKKDIEEAGGGGCCGMRKLVWRFTAWQYIWIRLIPALLTWAAFVAVTAGNAGKTVTIRSAWEGSQQIVACMVYKNVTTSTWWEDPYRPTQQFTYQSVTYPATPDACGDDYVILNNDGYFNATLIYRDSGYSGQKCTWGSIATKSDSLRKAESYGKWAYATPIITAFVSIFVLCGAFLMSDANKKSGGSTSQVSRKWTDTQVTVTWQRNTGKCTLPWTIKEYKVVDFYAVERVGMDRNMILYLPIALQNHIKKTERLIFKFLKDWGDAPPPNELATALSTPYQAMADMEAELKTFTQYYEQNTPPPPPPLPESADEKEKLAHKSKVAKYNKEKKAVVEAVREYESLDKDLVRVREAMEERIKKLNQVKKGSTDAHLLAGVADILKDFDEYVLQLINPDRKKGSNIFASVGPMTLLRAGIQNSPAEVPAQCLSLLLATITFANNFYCDANITDVTSTYSDSPFQEGCPKALVTWWFVSVGALKAYSSMSGITALAVFLSLVNSIITITSKMDKQTAELIKRIKMRGQDFIVHTSVGDEPPPPACMDSCYPASPRVAAPKLLSLDDADSDSASSSLDSDKSKRKTKENEKAGVGKKKANPVVEAEAEAEEVELDEVVATDGTTHQVDLSKNEVYNDDGEVIGKWLPKSKKVKTLTQTAAATSAPSPAPVCPPASKAMPKPSSAKDQKIEEASDIGVVAVPGVMGAFNVVGGLVTLVQSSLLICSNQAQGSLQPGDIEFGNASTPVAGQAPGKKKKAKAGTSEGADTEVIEPKKKEVARSESPSRAKVGGGSPPAKPTKAASTKTAAIPQEDSPRPPSPPKTKSKGKAPSKKKDS